MHGTEGLVNPMRDRLIEILREPIPVIKGYDVVGESRMSIVDAERYADRILANSVIVPPCKVGDVVYSPRENGILEQNVISIEIEKDPHVRVYFTCDYLCDGCPHNRTYQNQDGDGGCWGEYGESFFAFEDFGKTVFITREEAERALKGESHEHD